VQGLQSTITGFQNSLGDIHGSVTKLEQELESQLSQCVHNMASSSNVQNGGSKFIDSVINLKTSTFEKSNRTHVPRMELGDIGHIRNGSRDYEYYMTNLMGCNLTNIEVGTKIEIISTIHLEETKAICCMLKSVSLERTKPSNSTWKGMSSNKG